MALQLLDINWMDFVTSAAGIISRLSHGLG